MFEFYLLMSAIFLAVVILVVVLVVVNRRKNQPEDTFEINDDMIDAGDDIYAADVISANEALGDTLNKTVETCDDGYHDERLLNRLNNVHDRRQRDD